MTWQMLEVNRARRTRFVMYASRFETPSPPRRLVVDGQTLDSTTGTARTTVKRTARQDDRQASTASGARSRDKIFDTASSFLSPWSGHVGSHKALDVLERRSSRDYFSLYSTPISPEQYRYTLSYLVNNGNLTTTPRFSQSCRSAALLVVSSFICNTQM
jgi:hypothetical protein